MGVKEHLEPIALLEWGSQRLPRSVCTMGFYVTRMKALVNLLQSVGLMHLQESHSVEG